MKRIKSISPIEKVYETSGSQPILILCEDLNYYVCKYTRYPGATANKLLWEYLGASFAKLWNFNIPDFCLVDIKAEHIIQHSSLQSYFFKTPCFGSLYNRNYKEIDKFIDVIEPSDKKKFTDKSEFLKIALFDIWICNEDRSYNNYNLMIHSLENGYQFVPIDHEMIFNTGNLDKELYLISDSENIISTPLTKKLFTRKELANQIFLESIRKEYYLCIENCNTKLEQILHDIPDEWLVDVPLIRQSLSDSLFKKKWLEECFNEFLNFIQLANH